MNSELCNQALDKVKNPNVLVNVVSRRVRQLNSGGGGLGRPLVQDTAGLGAADIALREIIEGAIDFELLTVEEEHTGGRRKKKKAS